MKIVLTAGKVTSAMPWTRPAALMVRLSARLAVTVGGEPGCDRMPNVYHASRNPHGPPRQPQAGLIPVGRTDLAKCHYRGDRAAGTGPMDAREVGRATGHEPVFMLLLANRCWTEEVSELYGDVTTTTSSAPAQRAGER